MQFLPLLQLLPAIIGLMQMAQAGSKPGTGVAKKQFVVGMVKVLFGALAKADDKEDEFDATEESLGHLIDIIAGLLFK